MKRFLFLAPVLLLCLCSYGQTSETGFTVNDTLGYLLSPEKAGSFTAESDSANRLRSGCGIPGYFSEGNFSLFYRHGVCYMITDERLLLFQVMIAGTSNKMKINGKEISAKTSQKTFEKQFREYKASKQEAERIKGLREYAYTISSGPDGPPYRIFFRDGEVHSLLLYISCP
jgi:hypothetical protein